MKERVCQFGRDLNLVGILAEPEEKDLRADAPTLLMLNAGLLHHVGPHRMSVELAHRLADKGIRSLRFDIGGYGDSELSTDADSDETLIVSDIKSAMDFLEAELNCHIFVLTGLCAGADNSHVASLRDARVVGEVLLDAPGYWTTRSYVTHYLPRMFRPGTWLRFFRRILFPSKHAPQERTLLDQELRRPFGPSSRLNAKSNRSWTAARKCSTCTRAELPSTTTTLNSFLTCSTGWILAARSSSSFIQVSITPTRLRRTASACSRVSSSGTAHEPGAPTELPLRVDALSWRATAAKVNSLHNSLQRALQTCARDNGGKSAGDCNSRAGTLMTGT